MSVRCVITVMLASVLVGLPVSAVEIPKAIPQGTRVVTTVRADAPLVVDGILNDACWRKVKAVTNFLQLGSDKPAHHQSFGYVCYDDAHLYVGMKCLMPKGPRPVGEVRPHDSNIFCDEGVEIMLDPGLSRSNHYQIAVNAYGSVFDCMRLHEARIEELSWNSKAKTATHHGDGYWSVEVAIPFRSLAAPAQAGRAWGINLCRGAKNPNELSTIALRSGFNQVSHFPVLKGLELDYGRAGFASPVTVKVTNVPWRKTMFVAVNMSRMPKLPATAWLSLSLRHAGREVAGFPRKIGNLDRRTESVVKIDMNGLPAGEYDLRAVLCNGSGKPLIRPVTVKATWSRTGGSPMGAGRAKKLNNFVTELLNPSARGLAERRGKYEFTSPREGWVFVSCSADVPDAGSVRVSIDSDPSLKDIMVVKEHARSPVEAMRYLCAGRHEIVIQRDGKPTLKRLIVRAVPELGYATYPLRTRAPELDPGGVPFLEKHVLSSVNCIASRGDMSQSGHQRFVEAWKKQGKRWLAEFSVREVPDADTAYDRIVKNQGFQLPLLDGCIGNEFTGSILTSFPSYAKALGRIRQEPKYGARTFYAYLTTFASDNAKELIRTLIESNYVIAWERYLKELDSEASAWRYLEQALAAPAAEYEKANPGFVEHLMIAVGYLSAPPESQDTNPTVDFRVYLDMQFNLFANHPVFDGLYGIQMYQNNYAEEETQRWAAKLMRHYCIEGHTKMLSTDPYEMDYITNPDFTHGTTG